jgi:nucleotide-binding universal stress UspA family protein
VFKKIAVALDGSENSERALPLAVELAERDQAELEFIHIDEHLVGKATDLPIVADEDEVVAKMKRQAKELEERGLKVSVKVKETRLGGPAHAIVAVADEGGVDLIVAGRRGHSPISGLLLGSVTQRLLQVAHQPVLVVPAKS